MIHWISSPDHPCLEPYRHVGDPGWLRQQDLFVAEGRLVVERLLGIDLFQVSSILVNRAAHDAMLERLAGVDGNVYVCDDPSLRDITGFNFHRGCIALVRRPPPAEADWLRDGSLLLALEGVGNPDNVGGLFRSAAAFNVDGILLSPKSGDPFYRKAIRTSMGAVLRLPFAHLQDWPAGLERFQARGFKLVALTPHPDAVPIAQFGQSLEADERLILLVGAEGAGLDRATIERADLRVRIPIDTAVDSLNVTVAASIVMERVRSRMLGF
jgi:tRNA G18 (ribose-2'-O)-methylase SpoU